MPTSRHVLSENSWRIALLESVSASMYPPPPAPSNLAPKAPEDLHDAIYRQIHGQMTGAFTEVVTQYSMTEISIEIDEFGQIEHREVTIEHTEEIRFLNGGIDDTDPNGQVR